MHLPVVYANIVRPLLKDNYTRNLKMASGSNACLYLLNYLLLLQIRDAMARVSTPEDHHYTFILSSSPTLPERVFLPVHYELIFPGPRCPQPAAGLKYAEANIHASCPCRHGSATPSSCRHHYHKPLAPLPKIADLSRS